MSNPRTKSSLQLLGSTFEHSFTTGKRTDMNGGYRLVRILHGAAIEHLGSQGQLGHLTCPLLYGTKDFLCDQRGTAGIHSLL